MPCIHAPIARSARLTPKALGQATPTAHALRGREPLAIGKQQIYLTLKGAELCVSVRDLRRASVDFERDTFALGPRARIDAQTWRCLAGEALTKRRRPGDGQLEQRST